MKDELGGKIMTKFVGLEKLQLMMTVIDDGSEDENAKGTKNVA